MKKLLATIMFFSCFAIQAQAETTKCKAITKLPYEIEVAGVYCLKKNLTFAVKGVAQTSGSAIRIYSSAAGTVLDLNGFTLSGGDAPSTTSTIGIRLDAANTIVRNGTIKNFETGIYGASYASGIIVEDLMMSSNFSMGIRLYAANNIIRNNVITDIGGYTGTPNASAYGIYIEGNDNSIYNNTIAEVTGTGSGYGLGISCSTTASRNIITNNTISNINTTAGIWIQGGTNHIVSGNRITKPGSYGIDFDGTGSYMGNLVVGATSSSYSGGTAAGTTNY